MLDLLGQTSPRPRRRGFPFPPEEPGKGQNKSAQTYSTPWHEGHTAAAHPIIPTLTEAQRHKLGIERQEAETAQATLRRPWEATQRSLGLTSTLPLARPPYAMLDQEDRRALPGHAVAGTSASQPAGRPISRDHIGAPKLGGLTDFGLEHEGKASARGALARGGALKAAAVPVLQQTSPSVATTADSFGDTFGSSRGSIQPLSARCLQSPREIRQRDLKSVPLNMGFSFPSNSGPRHHDREDDIQRTEQEHRPNQYYPLSHSVLQAQYTCFGIH